MEERRGWAQLDDYSIVPDIKPYGEKCYLSCAECIKKWQVFHLTHTLSLPITIQQLYKGPSGTSTECVLLYREPVHQGGIQSPAL